MLNFSIFGFPVMVHWMFWVLCILIGGGVGASSTAEITHVVAFIIAAFSSILIHELGHAFAMRHYGAKVQIILHNMGGVAIADRSFKRGVSFLVSLSGPLLQVVAACLVMILLSFIEVRSGTFLASVLGIFITVSWFWAILNLIPIFPLDGGQMLHAILGPKRFKITLGIGLVLCALLGVYCLLSGMLFATICLAFLAYQNYQLFSGKKTSF